MNEMTDGYRLTERNFYGQLKIREDGDPEIDEFANLQLVHGTIEPWRAVRPRKIPA